MIMRTWVHSDCLGESSTSSRRRVSATWARARSVGVGVAAFVDEAVRRF